MSKEKNKAPEEKNSQTAEAEAKKEEIKEKKTDAEPIDNQEEKKEVREEIKEETKKSEEDKYEKQIEELNARVSETQDRFQRTLAEFDNFRKRTMKEKASMYDDGVRDTIEKLLPLFDNLERAIGAVEGKIDENDPLFKGVKLTEKQLKEILASIGVEEIKALGEKFDPNLHAAVAHVDDESYGENEVIIDMQKGYKYKDKVIRHSMVKVAN